MTEIVKKLNKYIEDRNKLLNTLQSELNNVHKLINTKTTKSNKELTHVLEKLHKAYETIDGQDTIIHQCVAEINNQKHRRGGNNKTLRKNRRYRTSVK